MHGVVTSPSSASEPEAERPQKTEGTHENLLLKTDVEPAVTSDKSVVELVVVALSAMSALKSALEPGLAGEWLLASTPAVQHLGLLLKLNSSEGVD